MDDTPEFDDLPSKSQRKRDMDALQAIGAELTELNEQQLATIDLPESLRDAVREARAMKHNEARRRLVQYIGKLMRQLDAETLDAVRSVLAEQHRGSASDALALHQVEQWRDRLIAESPQRDALLPLIEEDIRRLVQAAELPGNGDEYIETVTRLNRLLTQAAGNRRLQTILSSLAVQTVRYTRLGLSSADRRRQSVRHWQGLLQAIHDGDGDAAERIARQRVIDSRDAAVDLLRAQQAAA